MISGTKDRNGHQSSSLPLSPSQGPSRGNVQSLHRIFLTISILIFYSFVSSAQFQKYFFLRMWRPRKIYAELPRIYLIPEVSLLSGLSANASDLKPRPTF